MVFNSLGADTQIHTRILTSQTKAISRNWARAGLIVSRDRSFTATKSKKKILVQENTKDSGMIKV